MKGATISSWLVAAALAPLGAVVAQDEGPRLLSEEPAGTLELQGENRLELFGSNSTYAIRVGREGELRYMARSRDNRREDRPVGLWLEGRTLRIERLAEAAAEPLLLEVAVSPGIEVFVEMDGGIVKASSLTGGLTVIGTDVEVDARAIKGPLSLELEAAELKVDHVEGSTEIEGQGIRGTLKNLRGGLRIAVRESDIDALTVSEQLDADLENTLFGTKMIRGEVEIQARGGEVDIEDATKGGRLSMEGTKLLLDRCKGDFEVESDGEVDLRTMDGELRVFGFGTKVRGIDKRGPTEIQTDDGLVALENVWGPMRIEGSHLLIQVKGMKADLSVQTVDSSIVIDGAEAPLDISNELGDVTVRKATKDVRINSRDGNVTATELGASLQLKADGPEVEVSWSTLAGEKDSSIENPGGQVRVNLPRQATCKLTAEVESGTITSDLAEIRVADDGASASGLIGRAARPKLTIKAGRDLHVGTAQPSAVKPSGQ